MQTTLKLNPQKYANMLKVVAVIDVVALAAGKLLGAGNVDDECWLIGCTAVGSRWLFRRDGLVLGQPECCAVGRAGLSQHA